MNKVQLIGRITKDVELRETSNQTKFCNFTLAVDRRFKDANGQRQADFINCTAWRQTAAFIAGHFKKGSPIAVCGSIQTRTYDDNGKTRQAVEVIVEEAEFTQASIQDPKPQETPATEEPQQKPAQEEQPELPFEI